MPSCIYNVGQTLTLTANVVAGTNVGLVWKLWDGTTITTPPGAPTTLDYTLNRSGDVTASVTGVDDLGRASTSNFTFYVNQPPIISDVSVSDNYDNFPYFTNIGASAVDPDGDSNAIQWDLYTLDAAGDHVDLIGGVAPIVGPTLAANLLVESPMTVYMTATDLTGGITTIQFDLSGIPKVATAVNALPMTINPLVGQVISDAAVITASVIITDVGTPTGFLWHFWGQQSFDPGTTVEIADGVWCNTIVRSTADAPEGRQTVTCVATYSDGSYTSPPILGTVLLWTPLPPMYAYASVTPSSGVSPGTSLVYTVAAGLSPNGGVLDPDGYTQRGGSSLYYKWNIAIPIEFPEETVTIPTDFPTDPAVVTPNNVEAQRILTFYGPTVTIPTTGMLPGDTLTATLVVSTDLGGQVTAAPPPAVTLVSATLLGAAIGTSGTS